MSRGLHEGGKDREDGAGDGQLWNGPMDRDASALGGFLRLP